MLHVVGEQALVLGVGNEVGRLLDLRRDVLQVFTPHDVDEPLGVVVVSVLLDAEEAVEARIRDQARQRVEDIDGRDALAIALDRDVGQQRHHLTR